MDDFIMNDPVFLSLDGEWEFFYSPQRFTPPLSQLPATELYTGRMVTPGYWDDHYELYDEEDFFGLTARFNPDYRKPHFPMGRSLLRTPPAVFWSIPDTTVKRLSQKKISPVQW